MICRAKNESQKGSVHANTQEESQKGSVHANTQEG